MMEGARGKYGTSKNDGRYKRFCIPCGVKSGLYKPGTEMYYGGSMSAGGGYGVACEQCKQLKRDRASLGCCAGCTTERKRREDMGAQLVHRRHL